jgi:hypothetical protein
MSEGKMSVEEYIKKQPKHALAHLVNQAAMKMAAEYERLRAVALHDSGTAGDQGEENWADFLRNWLPEPFHVRTKGQIVFAGGDVSPQIDVLVLSPFYPKGLMSDKLYIAAGVVAAFECKLTLRRRHVLAVTEKARRLGELTRADERVDHHIIYGLLAHSHDLASKRRPPAATLDEAIIDADRRVIEDPHDCIDFVCVPSIGTWSLMRLNLGTTLTTVYMGPQLGYTGFGTEADSLARLITGLMRRLGDVDRSIGLIAEYLHGAKLFGTGSGQGREWVLSEVPDDLMRMIY